MPTPDDGTPTGKPSMAAQRLRNATDSGRTGDKVPYDDPAAAPLGTDDEAAGNRPQENVAPMTSATAGTSAAEPRIPGGQAKGYEISRGNGIGVAAISMVAVVALALIVVAMV